MGLFKKIGGAISDAVGSVKSEAQKAAENVVKTQKEIQAKIAAAESKRKADAAKLAKKAQETAKQVSDKIKQVATSLIKDKNDIPFLPIAPLKGVMSDALKRKNISTDGSLKDVAIKFHDNIVRGKNPNVNNFNGKSVNLLSGRGIIDNKENYFNYNAEEKKDNTTWIAAVLGIVAAIVKWFKDKKAAKKAKEQAEKDRANGLQTPMPDLSEEELRIINEADSVSEDLIAAAERDLKKEAGFGATETFITVALITIIIGFGIKTFMSGDTKPKTKSN